MIRACLVFACLMSSGAARAEVVFSGIKWQMALPVQGGKDSFKDAEIWRLPPGLSRDGRPRALVTLINRGTLPEGAAVLRYAFSARLVRIDGSDPGTWAIPFIVEDRRIPQTIGANAVKEVPLNVNRVALDAYMKRMYRSGFWVDALRVQVELEPRRGETFKDKSLEATLPVEWKRK